MKKLVALLFVSLTASLAFAGLDPDLDSFGLYYDAGGYMNCAAVGPFVPTNVYLLLSNPVGPTDGFECTLTPVGVPHFILSTNLGPAALDIDSSANGYVVGAASNYPVVNGQIVLATLQFMLAAPGSLEFFITQATVPSMPGDLPVVTGNGVLRRCGVSSGAVSIPVLGMNPSFCPVSEEISSFGDVKSLFR